MQTLMNIIAIAATIYVIGAVLHSLMRSQKESEEPLYAGLKMVVDLHSIDGAPGQRLIYMRDSVKECQELLNSFSFPHIKRAGVFQRGNLTAIMNPNGLLELL